ncbi:Sua5/YciO/YrdC/YwlC family protein [Vibrio zhugei]|uniref:Threonylcarbamoyl-AMP synthase n=1 Tax=Vibrio zhugei TaxID=2479546 RepID=A0ABV7C832_9VIBR|nr:Sua5/YciO/YrdC/YwlC family protein [Vibrio zhugei]
MNNIQESVSALVRGEVIAYPTEGVFGVGCDPDNPLAIQKLLTLKQRSKEKGLILIAANYEQLLPYVNENVLTEEQRAHVKQTWPGPVTWIMPASEHVSSWVTGQFDSVAVRVSDHPLVQSLCQAYGKPITSTSANLSGMPPCMTTQDVEQQLRHGLGAILAGETGGRERPTEIRDAKTLHIVRQG